MCINQQQEELTIESLLILLRAQRHINHELALYKYKGA